jgi:hypothetical protein
MEAQIRIHNTYPTVAVIENEGLLITEVQDALDLMVNAGYSGAGCIIIREEHLSEDFFNLRSGLAGEILQKFSNYRMKLAIVGDFSKYQGKSLRDFIYESNKTGRIIFTDTIEKAIETFSVG